MLAKKALKQIKEISEESFFKKHSRRFGMGILVLCQALAFGIVGGIIYYALVFYKLVFPAVIFILILIYFAGAYEEMKRKKLYNKG